MSQLDIFEDSRDVMLRNDVLEALQQRNAFAARDGLRRLALEYPADLLVPVFEVLLQVLERPVLAPVANHDALRRIRDALIAEVEPAARRAFGEKGGAQWLAPLWRAFAQAARQLGWRRETPDLHAGPLWMKAGEWSAARDSIAQIESWRRIPVTLTLMAEVQYRLYGIEATWPLVAELAWLAPQRLDMLMSHLGDPSLAKLRKAFDAEFDGEGTADDLAWFPAWVLTEKTGLAPLLARAEPSLRRPPEQGMRLMLELLTLERQGRQQELFARRKTLHDLHAGLFAAYIRTR